MRGLPLPVLDYLQTFILETRSPAYLQVDFQGRLRGWGGVLRTYGIAGLRRGSPVTSHIDFLQGLLPLDDSPLCLPCVETTAGVFADIHLFAGERGAWVLLLDATVEEAQRRLLQQKVHEFRLWQEREGGFPGGASATPGTRHAAQLLPGPDGEWPAPALFAALDTVILERLRDGTLRLIGEPPPWFREFYPDAIPGQEGLLLGRMFLFLDNFLIDAEAFWSEQRPGHLRSGLWSETSPAGRECHLEACALCWRGRKVLLIAFPQLDYEERQRIIQQARENRLRYHHFDKEIQQRDILLHCIVHDLAGPLTAILAYFALLDFENLTPKAKSYVRLGIQQATRQQALIQQILDVFAVEMGTLEAYTLEYAQAPDVARCVKGVVDALLPAALLKEIQLRLSPGLDLGEEWRVVGEKSRLERVIFNLVENALRHGPAGSTVTVDGEVEDEAILICVEDEGHGVPLERVGSLFEKFSQGRGQVGKAGLGLYFCRIMVERWGGNIGYAPRPQGGSRFWFRLPRPRRV
jgi:signal transduction histidine kinase